MGHEGTPRDIEMVSRVVMVKSKADRGVSMRLLEAEWQKNQVKVV